MINKENLFKTNRITQDDMDFISTCRAMGKTWREITLDPEVRTVIKPHTLKTRFLRYICDQKDRADVISEDIPATDMDAPTGSDIETITVLADIHASAGVTNTLLPVVTRFMTAMKTKRILLLGDILDCGCISHHNAGKPGITCGQTLKKDYAHLQGIINGWHKSMPGLSIDYLMGNHEEWVTQYIEAFPQLKGLLEIERNIKGVRKFYPYNSVVKLGRLSCVHEPSIGRNQRVPARFATKTLLEIMHDNAMGAHTHQSQQYAETIYGVRPISSWILGSLCEINPGFLRGADGRWQNTFAIVTVEKSTGLFWVEIVWVIDHRIAYGGKLYT